MGSQAGHTRRSFIKAAGVAAAAPSLTSIAFAGDDAATPPVPFAPEIGVCTSTTHAELLRSAGASYIEESVRRILVPDQPDAAFAEKLKAAQQCGLPVTAANGFLPGSLKCVGSQADHAAVLRYAETAFTRASLIGIKTIVFGSSGARSIPEGFDRRRAELQFAALLGKMAILARPRDVVIAVEPLNKGETNFINTVREGTLLVRAVQHPNVKLVADVFHMLRENEPAGHIRDAGDLIRHIHIAEKRKRTPPGVDGDDFLPYFQALKDIGYRGRVSIECRWNNLSEELPTAVNTLRKQMAHVQ